MKPVRLFLKNFMNHKVSEIDCTKFSSVLISGRHKDSDRISNGVGKTTIFSAIEWVFYNESHSTTLEKVIREGSKKAIVEFDFELDSKIYRVYRHRTIGGASDLRLYQWDGSEWEPISERTPSATDKKLQNLIKISHKSFTYSVLFRQADLKGLSSVKDAKARKEILKEPLDLLKYSKLEKIAGDKARPIKREIGNVEASIKTIGEPEIAKLKAEELLEDVVKELKSKQFNLDTEVSVILDKKHENLEDLKASLDSSGSDLQSKVTRQRNIVDGFSEEVEKLSLKSNNSKKTICSINDDIINSNQLLKEETDILAEEMAIKHRPPNEIKKEIIDIRNNENKGIELVAKLKAQAEIARESLPDSDTCNSCHQSITKEYREEFTDKINKKIVSIKTDLEFYEDILSKCKGKRLKLDKELSKSENSAKRISKLEYSVKHINNKIISSKEAISLHEKNLNTADKELSSVSSKLQEAIKLFDVLKQKSGNSKDSVINSKIFSIQEEISMYERAKKTLYEEISNLKSKEGALEERISMLDEDIDNLFELKKKATELTRDLKIRKMVIDTFSHRGIPNFIIQNLLDELNLETNKALHELRPELSIQLDSELNIEYRRHGKLRDYGMLSHGQHVYIALAFKRGLATVIKKRIGIEIGMLAFDEVDSNLDESGVDAFADCVRKWQKDFTIFVITHNKDLKDTFSHAIMVEEGEDGSDARLVSGW